MATVRGRLGLTIDRTLLYATGGLALGNVTDGAWQISGCPNCLHIQTHSKTAVGWTVGGGAEYMLTPNWIAGGEFLYVDLGKNNNTTTPAGDRCYYSRAHHELMLGRLKLDYKF